MMRAAKARLDGVTVGGALALLGGLVFLQGCVPDGQWFTPAGVALGEIDCISPAPLAGATGREICKARLIGDTPGAIAECRRQGGTTGPVSVADARFACTYPKTTPNADGGSDGQGRSPNFTGTKT